MSLPAGHTKRDALATKRTPDVADVFASEHRAVAKAVKNAGEDASQSTIKAAALGAIKAHKGVWQSTLHDLHKDAAHEAAKHLIGSLPGDFPLPDDYEADDYEDDDALSGYAASGADSISQTNTDRIAAIIAGMAAGAALALYLSSIKDSYDTWQGAEDGGDVNASRSSVIAGDAVTAGWGYGECDTLSSLLDAVDGAQGAQTWNTVGDSHVRPTHADADGQTAEPGDTFSVGYDELRYPGDPDGSPEETANCRCYLTAAISYTPSDEGEKARRLSRLARKHRRDTYRAYMEALT